MYSLLTGVFPALTVSLPHPQISEASRSCELTRWSETGGSDPKDPPWPLSTLRLSPCTSQWRRVGQDQSKRRRFYKRVGESFIYLWKSFLDRRSLLFLSLSLSKATKAQTFKKKKSSHPFLYSHTYPNTTHQCVALLWGGRKRHFLESGVWEDTSIHTASTTWASLRVQSINKDLLMERYDRHHLHLYPYFSMENYNSTIINTTWVKLDRPKRLIPFC